MIPTMASMEGHRVHAVAAADVIDGAVRWSPAKSLWFLGMAGTTVLVGPVVATPAALALFVVGTGVVLLFGHSLGSHRKLIHDSYAAPRWLEYLLVYLGVQVGLAGPLGLLRQHELRDYAQRLPDCHDYLRHGRSPWVDAWWQLNCELALARPPVIRIEARIADDRFYRFLERTWMAQQLPWALLFFLLGGWGFVVWGVCARVTAGVFGHWLIGYFAHNQGGMHHRVAGAAVQGRNVRLASLVTMGESWHNNHHAFPGSSRLGMFAGEWDPGWWMLVLMARVGLVRNLRHARDLPTRPELVAVDRTAHVVPATPRPRIPSLRETLRLCRGDDSAPRPLLRWPGVLLSRHRAARLFGHALRLRHDPRAERLTLETGGLRILGWPALLIATARRAPLARVLVLALLPLALAGEHLRELVTELPESVP